MDIVFQVYIKKGGMMATGPIKIGIDTSELNSAIKKAEKLGGILRSIEKRVDDIAKKQGGIGVFFDEFAPIKEDAFKKLIDNFGNYQPIIADDECERVIEDKVVLELTAAGLSVTLNDRKSFTLGRCMRCHEFPFIEQYGENKYSIKCDCLETIKGDIKDIIKSWDYASKRKRN